LKIDVYCDESHPDLFASGGSEFSFMVLGGLWCARGFRDQFKSEIHHLRDKHQYGGEFKWQKVTPAKAGFYLDLIDWFFDKGDDLRFRCIVIDKNKVDLAKYHDDDQELGFYKFYYQLLKHWIKPSNSYQVFLDFKTNRQRDRLDVLHRCLGHACPNSEVIGVQAIRSRESVLIQVADFLTGAASASLNRSILSSDSKRKVISEIESRLGGGIRSTVKWEKKFNVFAIQLNGGW